MVMEPSRITARVRGPVSRPVIKSRLISSTNRPRSSKRSRSCSQSRGTGAKALAVSSAFEELQRGQHLRTQALPLDQVQDDGDRQAEQAQEHEGVQHQ